MIHRPHARLHPVHCRPRRAADPGPARRPNPAWPTLLGLAASLLVSCAAARRRVALSPPRAVVAAMAAAAEPAPAADCTQQIERHRTDVGVDRALLETYVREHRDDWAVAVRLASILNDEGKHEAAMAVVQAASRPANAFLLREQARASTEPAAKEAAARQALAMRPILAGAVFELAFALSSQGRFAEAAIEYERCTALRGLDVAAWYNQGLAHAYAGDRARAAAALWSCIARSLAPGEPVEARYWAALASLYEDCAEWPSAARWFRERAGATPGLQHLPPHRGAPLPPPPEAAADFGLTLATGAETGKVLRLGRYSLAERAGLQVGDFVRAVQGRPLEHSEDPFTQQLELTHTARPGEEVTFSIIRNGVGHELRARAAKDSERFARVASRLDEAKALFDVGDFAGARGAYGDVLESLVLNEAALVGMVQCSARASDPAAVVAFLQRWMVAYPQQTLFAYGLAHWLAESEKWEELRRLIDQVRAWHPEYGDLAAIEGRLALHGGRPDAARLAFHRALRLGYGGIDLRRLAQGIDDDVRAARAREATQRLAEAERREAESERQQAEAKRLRQESNQRALLMLQMLGGLRSGGGIGVPGVSTVPTGPTHLQQWSDQQMANGMWSHNR